MAMAAALRGRPLSHTSTRRRQRPSTRAALRPAGPPPTMTTSYMHVQEVLERRQLAQRVEIGVAQRPRGGELGIGAGDAAQRLEGALVLAAQRQQGRHVVAREWIVGTARDTGVEGFQRPLEVAPRFLGASLLVVGGADLEIELDLRPLAQRMIA